MDRYNNRMIYIRKKDFVLVAVSLISLTFVMSGTVIWMVDELFFIKRAVLCDFYEVNPTIDRHATLMNIDEFLRSQESKGCVLLKIYRPWLLSDAYNRDTREETETPDYVQTIPYQPPKELDERDKFQGSGSGSLDDAYADAEPDSEYDAEPNNDYDTEPVADYDPERITEYNTEPDRYVQEAQVTDNDKEPVTDYDPERVTEYLRSTPATPVRVPQEIVGARPNRYVLVTPVRVSESETEAYLGDESDESDSNTEATPVREPQAIVDARPNRYVLVTPVRVSESETEAYLGDESDESDSNTEAIPVRLPAVEPEVYVNVSPYRYIRAIPVRLAGTESQESVGAAPPRHVEATAESVTDGETEQTTEYYNPEDFGWIPTPPTASAFEQAGTEKDTE